MARFEAMREGWRGAALAVVLGAVLALGHAPVHLWFLVFGAVPGLVWLALGRGPRGGALLGWLAGVGYFAVALNWIVEPFLVDAARTGWMAPFALALLAAGLALFWAVAFGIARAGRAAGLTGLVLLAACWTGAEYARSVVLTGFPWALLAYVWEGTPLMQGAAFLGPHGMGLLTVLTAGLIGVGRRFLPVLAACLLAVGWFGFPARVPDEVAQTEVVLRLVQPNVDQALKWKPEYGQVFFDRLLDLSEGHDGVDAVIWPEAAPPYLVSERADLNGAVARSARAPVLMGALARRADGAVVNGLYALGSDGGITGSYAKHHLVPFGEYLPFPGVFDALGLQALATHAGRLTRGSGPAAMEVGGLPPFQPLICYEAIFPGEILRGAARPDWLLHVTNDAWFGEVSGPYQHLAQARFRAVEQGLPVVRVANTGISTVIDPYGRTGAFLGLGEMGALDSVLPAPAEVTVYARFGDTPALSAALALGALGMIGIRRSRQRKSAA